MSDMQCAARFLIVRHAEAEAEPGKRRVADPGLSELGQHQARELAQAVRADRVAGVYTSRSARARQTAQIVAGELHSSAEDLPGVEEYDFQADDPGADAAAHGSADRDAHATVTAWWRGELEARLPSGVSGLEVSARFARAIEDCADAYRGETVLVISHGGIMSLALGQFARRPDVLAAHWLAPCDIARVDVDADGWALRHWPGTADPATAGR